MKKLIALTALFALTADLTAGDGWLTNLDKAKAVAKKEKKMIIKLTQKERNIIRIFLILVRNLCEDVIEIPGLHLLILMK